MKILINQLYIYITKHPTIYNVLQGPTIKLPKSSGHLGKRVHNANLKINENIKSLPIHRPDRSHIVQDLALKLKQKKYPHSIIF